MPDRVRRPEQERPPVWERVVDIVETLGAAVACGLLATLPWWLAELAAAPGLPVLPAFIVAGVVVFIVPALRRVPGQPQLDGFRRWGTNVGRALRVPLSWAERRRRERRPRALGAASASSSTAAPSLTSARLDR